MPSLRGFLKDYLKENFSVEEIVDKYKEWVSESTYMILSRWNDEKWKNDVFAIKCSKRGNDIYRLRVKNRFVGLSHKSEQMVFFNPKDRVNDKTTCALWTTLTYDTKLCSYKEAWEQIGIEFNAFMAYVRRNFGKVSTCRVFESFENGYPHIHCILLFQEYSFKVFRDAKGQFRVREKDIIAQGWHSNVDVKAMNSLAGGFSYLKKYLLKGIDFENADSKGLKTLALCWVYRKRAFAVSGTFRKALADLITDLHNSNKPLVQLTLLWEIIPEEKFILLGFINGNKIKLEKNQWFVKLDSEQVSLLNDFLNAKSYF
ncbi:MAG: rolling circle replication-associated protein [Candidatus Bathyarchaeia archaeon]